MNILNYTNTLSININNFKIIQMMINSYNKILNIIMLKFFFNFDLKDKFLFSLIFVFF